MTLPVLQGRSCTLRRLELRDAESIARHGNDRDVWRNLRDRFPLPYSRADAESYIAHVLTRDPVTSFGIIVEDEAVGSVGLVLGHDIERASAEIGYWIGRAYWGRGIVTDAIGVATGHAFATLGIHRVFAVPFAHNAASVRVLEKCGYVREGAMRHSALKDGVLEDQLLFAAYADRWVR